MNSKLTRRAVLVTVIGGLVTGPFVMRYLRKSHIPVSGGENFAFWQDTWKESIDKVVPKTKTLEMAQNIDCQFQHIPGKKLRYTILVPVYHDLSSDKSVTPDAFMRKCGECSMIINSDIDLIRCEDKDVLVVAPTKIDSTFPKNNFTLSVRNNRLVPVSIKGTTVTELDLDTEGKVSKYYPYRNAIIDNSSKNLCLGQTWEISDPFGGEFVGVIKRVVLGLCEIDAKTTVKVNTSQEISFEHEIAFIQDLLSQIKDKITRDEIQKELETARKQKWRMLASSESYYDISSGLLVYSEYNKKMFGGDSQSLLSNESTLIRFHI